MNGPFLLVLMLGLVLRLTYVFLGPAVTDFLWSDMRTYVSIADDVLRGIWREKHFFQSIGYPLIIASFKKFTDNWSFTLALMQSLISTATLVPFYFMAKKSFGEKAALISLLIASFHLPWIIFNGFALPETIFTFLLAICGYLTMHLCIEEKPRLIYGLLWGVCFILAFWLKGIHVFWAPLFLASLFFMKKSRSWGSLFVISGVILIGLTLHGVLSKTKIEKVQLSSSTGGLNLVEGKCPHKSNTDSEGINWISPLYYQLDLHEEKKWVKPFSHSGYFMQQGMRCIRENPLVLIQSLEAIPFLFIGNFTWPLNQMKFAPFLRLYELLFSLFLIIGLALFVRYLLAQKEFSLFIIWLLPVLALFLCVYIFKSEARYRLPFDVWLIPIGVKGWRELLRAKFN